MHPNVSEKQQRHGSEQDSFGALGSAFWSLGSGAEGLGRVVLSRSCAFSESSHFWIRLLIPVFPHLLLLPIALAWDSWLWIESRGFWV